MTCSVFVRSCLGLLGVLFVAVVTSHAVVLPGGYVSSVDGQRVPGTLIVEFQPGVTPSVKSIGPVTVTGVASVDALSVAYGLVDYEPLFTGWKRTKAVAAAPDLSRFYIFRFPETVDLDKAGAEFLSDPNIADVGYDHYATIMRVPNDASFGTMRNLHNASDHDIDAPEAWDRTAGSPTVILADTDTGILYHHEDLEDNIWVNPGEDLDADGQVWDVGDLNGIDDDGNGFVDDLIGWDFVSGSSGLWPGEDGSVEDNDPSDFNGHGTHTSGTIAAVTNNGIGISGVAGGFGPGVEDGCRIMHLRMGYSFDDGGQENGRTHMSFVARAFRYAADNGAVAINYSFGSSYDPGIAAATDYAIANGLVISASAGNSNNSSFGYLQSRPDVLCVASVTQNDTKSSFSNYGVEVDVSAPGSSIRSTVSVHYTPSYAVFSGTSMAAPHVVGLVGLMKSLNPLLTGADIRARIISTAENIDALNPGYIGRLGSGRINADLALGNIASADFTATPVIGNAPLAVDFTDLSGTTPTAWFWDFGDGDSSMVQNPSHVFAAGLHEVSLRTATAIGDGFHVKPNFITALAETVVVASGVGEYGQPLMISVDLTNNLPVTEILLPVDATNVSPSGSASMDSIVYTGCRTSYFESKQTVFNNMFFGQAAVRLRADVGAGSPAMAPGSGPIAKIWFTIKPGAPPSDSIQISIESAGSNNLEMIAPTTSFTPIAHGGTITLPLLPGDLNFDESLNVLDVVLLINIAFRSAPPTDPLEIGDLTCDGSINVLDVVRLVGTVFRSDPPPVCP